MAQGLCFRRAALSVLFAAGVLVGGINAADCRRVFKRCGAGRLNCTVCSVAGNYKLGGQNGCA